MTDRLILMTRFNLLLIPAVFGLFTACAPRSAVSPAIPKPPPPAEVRQSRGFSIQVAAFAQKERADTYVSALNELKLTAFSSRTKNGMWAVRCGHFPSKTEAETHAQALLAQKRIDDFFIVNQGPDDSGTASDIVKTARKYLGVPYVWGGTSPKKGFDCSGFTWAVYRAHGVTLARNTRGQFTMGTPVDKGDLQKGDLLFFATGRRNTISHVGIYSGNDEFIHASTRARKIKTARLSKPYYKKRYRGARRILVR